MKNLTILCIISVFTIISFPALPLDTNKIIANGSSGLAFGDPSSLVYAAPYVIDGAPLFYNKFVEDPSSNRVIDLTKLFVGDGGSASLAYEVISIESNGFISGSLLAGGVLTINFIPGQLGSAKVIVKATDVNSLSGQYEFLVQVVPQPSAFIRINAGGNSYASWEADKYFTGGSVYSNPKPIANTQDDILFQTEHWGSNFSYNIPVPQSGYYRISLLFAEIYHGVENSTGIGARVFNVAAEGNLILSNFDIYLTAGGPAKALVEEIDSVLVTDGFLSLQFTGVVDNAKISAIQLSAYTFDEVPNVPPSVQNPGDRYVFEGGSLSIPIIASDLNFGDVLQYQASGLPLSLSIDPSTGLISGNIEDGPNKFPVIVTVTDNKGASSQVNFDINVIKPIDYSLRINAGGTAKTYGQEIWITDQFFLDGAAFVGTGDITNTTKDGVYLSERIGSRINYEIPMPGPGRYNVTLHFAEFFWNALGQRIFNVNIESGQASLLNYDIFQKAGGANLAVSETFTVDVTDGALTLLFTKIVDEAKISGIEISSCVSPSINSVSASVTEICNGGSTVITVNGNLGSATAWNLYTSSCGGTLVASNTTGIFQVSPTLTTTYYIKGEGGCGIATSCETIEIKVATTPDVTITAIGPICTGDASVNLQAATSGGKWSGVGIINSDLGLFDPSTAGAGNHTITYTLTIGTCTYIDTETVQVIQGPNATITSEGPFCESDSPVNLTATTAGGIWSGTGITDSSLGTFDPNLAAAGSHVISYEVSVGSCSSIGTKTIIVAALASDVTINAAGPFCANEAPVNLTAASNGGTWSGTGITNGALGTFDPKISGPGNFVITYKITAGACSAEDTETITVNAPSNATITPAGPFCKSDSPVNLVAATNGGTWSGKGITNSSLGTFSPSVAGPGSHLITYTIVSGVCTSIDTETIFIPDPTINAAGPFCTVDSPVTFGAATPGGTWSGAGITNTAIGTFDPSVAGPGSHVITYTIISGACTAVDSKTIQVSAKPNATISAAGPFCTSDVSVTLTAANSGGSWSGKGITNAILGTFSPTVAGPGSHVITYTINSGACTSIGTRTIQVTPPPNATITTTSPYCENDLPGTLKAATAGGTWSGKGITNASLGTFDPLVAGPGNHAITYSVTSGTCTSSDTKTIKVDAIPDLTLSAAGPFCSGSEPVTLKAATAGGTWSGKGITDALLGTFSPKVAGSGSHLIGYTLTSGACTALETETIQVDSKVVNATVTLSGNTLTATADGVSYQWINCADNTNIVGQTAKTFTPTQVGSYSVKLTDSGCIAFSSCIDVLIVGIEENYGDNVTVYPNPAIDKLTIELTKVMAGVKIDITDLTGRSAWKGSYDFVKTVEIDTKQFNAGIYLIRIKSAEVRTTIKVIIR